MRLLKGQRRDANIGMSIGLIIMLLPIYWLFDRKSPSEVYLNEIMNPENVQPGGYIFQHLKVKRLRFCSIAADRILIDKEHNKIILEKLDINKREKLGVDEYTQPIRVPVIRDDNNNKTIPAEGQATLVINVSWVCNPLHYLYPINTTARFDITIRHKPVPATTDK